ncbi:MAG: hypothetical protein KF893_03205 [Caldilineaceae bacterium]|nr:hypothetical protein [Caldilineaceae bacterium]
MSVFNALKLGSVWRIVSQINIEEIKKHTEQSFHLLVVADQQENAEMMARRLSDEAASFIHPWITATTPPIQTITSGQERIDLAIVVSEGVQLSTALKESNAALVRAVIPTLIIIVGQSATQPDATLSHRGEGKRIAAPVVDAIAVEKKVGEAIAALAPTELRLALGRRLPPLRPAVFQLLIQETAQANATYSFSTGIAEIIPALGIPLNVGDMIVLTKNQLVMAYKIALMAGKQGSPQQLLGEIMSVLGGGFLFRQLARQLVGLIPVWGIAPKVAIAYAGTWAIGQAVVLWAVEGQQITPDLLRQFYTEALARGQAVAHQLTENVRNRLPKPDPDQSTTGDLPFWQKVRRRLPVIRR